MIRIERLYKRLGGQQVLRGAELEVARGEILTLLGPSGTGKSVLLKHIIGLIQPDAGDVYVDGRSVGKASYSELAALRRRMGYVFQDGALLDSLTIRENLRLALADETDARSPARAERRIAETLALVNLDESVLDKRPNEVSGGMRKRVGVARAIINHPEIILYDEPTAGLDPQNVALIDDLILRTRDRFGATSVVITHDLGSVRRIADQVVLLNQGRVHFRGTAPEFFASPDSVVGAFTGRKTEVIVEVDQWQTTHGIEMSYEWAPWRSLPSSSSARRSPG
jgi:phospholipid/cholesterol/gamma-HCH transport system ATP-binding protein